MAKDDFVIGVSQTVYSSWLKTRLTNTVNIYQHSLGNYELDKHSTGSWKLLISIIIFEKCFFS